MRVLFEVAGDVQIDREILRGAGAVTDASPAFRAIGELLIDETKQQFASEGQHASGGWHALSPRRVRFKAAHSLRPQILQATGDLLTSLTEPDDVNMVFDVGPQELIYGTKLPYASVHQRPKPDNPLPRRRPLEFTEATRRAAVKILQRYLITGEVA